MENRKSQSAYEVARTEVATESLDETIRSAMYRYLREDLGLSESVAKDRAFFEINGRPGQSACDECEQAGLKIRGQRILDLGAGLGSVSVEASRRGAKVIALEPGAAWRSIAALRLGNTGAGDVIGAVGEQLPLADESIDLIISLQVLEHVRNPPQVIREAFRVLKPGGYFYLSYENYLSFWEPHYRVRWLPLLPKSIGAAWLRVLGRNPQFLLEAVTYTTFPAVRRAFRRSGFECVQRSNARRALHSPEKVSLKWKTLKTIGAIDERLALSLIAAYDYLQRTFKTGISELMRKPHPLDHKS
jgi:ubiquinone/menaquinone biosynthesis C-methylase UbiE